MSDSYITFFVLLLIFISLIRDFFTPAISFLGGLALLVIFGVIDETVAFNGFSNETLITIGALFVIAQATQKALNTEGFVKKVIGTGKRTRLSLLRMMVPVAASSAFLNNTPVVAMMIGPIIDWANKQRKSASLFLIPLSFAAIVGGTLTLIGTSTNLVVSGVLQTYGSEGLGFFELTPISLPVALVILVITILLAPKMLQPRDYSNISEASITKDFTLDAKPRKSLLGKSIEEAKLRHLKEVYLGMIIRSNGDIISPVSPQTVIKRGDVLRFSGNVESLIELEKKIDIKIVGHQHSDSPYNSTYFEVVVGQNKSLAGRTLSEIGFRSKYQAAVLAIFRAGEKIDTSLGNTRLKPGDSLLLASHHSFVETWQDRQDFLYIREISRHTTLRKKQGQFMFVVLGLVVALVVSGTPLAIAALVGAIASIAVKVLTPLQARNAINWDILLMIGAAIGVAKAVEVSGLASGLSERIINVFGDLGTIGLLAGVVITTAVLTELITNAAAALLVLPIAISTAEATNLDPLGFAVAIAITASMSFVSPFGYQTNTMVYSAGGYKIRDFARLGGVITIVALSMIVFLVNHTYYA